MLWYVLSHLQKLKDTQTKMIALGVISILMIQTLIHLGVNLKLLPNTGITLPFISAGGTSLLVSCIELILLYKILNSEKTHQLVSQEPREKKSTFRQPLTPYTTIS